MFKVLRNGLLRYILPTCPNLWCNSWSKCYAMDCFGTYFRCKPCSTCYGMDFFGTYFTHVQTCDVTRVQSATQWTASVHTSDVSRVQLATEWIASVHTSHMSKPVIKHLFKVLRNGLLRYILHTCPNLWCNSCSKCYGMDCFGTYFTHVQTGDVTRVQSARKTLFRDDSFRPAGMFLLSIRQRALWCIVIHPT